jgi:hypothetical protein
MILLGTLKQIASPSFLERILQFNNGKFGFLKNKFRHCWEKTYLFLQIIMIVLLASLFHLILIRLMGIQRFRCSRPCLIGLFSALI